MIGELWTIASIAAVVLAVAFAIVAAVLLLILTISEDPYE
jgi:hypothetical protein